jgi:hypothetical protein
VSLIVMALKVTTGHTLKPVGLAVSGMVVPMPSMRPSNSASEKLGEGLPILWE